MVSTPVRCTWPYKGTIRFLSTPPLGQPQEQSLPENLFKRNRQILSPPDANFKGSPTNKADGIYPLQGVGGRGGGADKTECPVQPDESFKAVSSRQLKVVKLVSSAATYE